MRYIILTLLLLAAHFSLTPFAPAQVGQAWIGWPFAADSNPVLSFVGGLPQQTGSVLTPLLAGVAGLGFIVAACALFGVGIPTAWWPTLVVGSTIASTLLYLLYLSPLALLPIGIDLLLLWGVWAQHWTATGLSGT